MNREVHPSLVQPSETSFCLNCNSETSTGDRPFITNEPSNILETRFPAGFKVIGYKYYMQNERTYFFLTNPETKLSSFGYVETTQNYVQEDDIQTECEDCNSYNSLGTPLEEITQQVIHPYVELLNDACNGAFNFDINFPIKTIEIKDEKVGLQIYFTDRRNPPRYIKLDNLEVYNQKTIPCEDGTTEVCLDVDLMRVFPHYEIPQITPAVIQLGGNLKLGTYEFLVAYCDLVGNEISEYYSITNPISIFDQNNRTLTQPDLDSQTNYAIRLEVEGLDLTYPYYKVVVIQRTDVQQAQSYFVEGIHNTADKTVVYSSENNKQRTTLSNILSIRTRYDKVKGLVASNGYLFQYGTTAKREINLQPVVNLFSQYLKWQTAIAKEDLYKDGVATSIYKGYNRDEVYAFGARFLSKDGSVSRIFPFIGRQANEIDLTEVDEESLDRMSIEANLNTCITTERTKRWQYYNDAALSDEFCSNDDIPTNTVEEEVTKVCLIDSIAVLPPAQFSIETGETFDTLENFIADTIIAGNCASVDCETPVGNPYPFCAYIDKNCYNDEHCEPIFEGCSEPTLTKEELLVRRGSVTGDGPDGKEKVTKIEKEFPTDYGRMKAPVSCNLYLINTDGSTPSDVEFENDYMGCANTTDRRGIFKRNENSSNISCASAEEIQNLTSVNNPSLSYSHYYYGADAEIDLELTKETVDLGTGWSNKLHKGALWFKGSMNERPSLIVEISKQLDPAPDDSNADGQIVRMSLYNKCNSTVPLFAKLVDLTKGDLYKFETVAGELIITYTNDSDVVTVENLGVFTGADFYIAIDNKIVTEFWKPDCGEVGGVVLKYRTAPTDGCFSIVTRNIEYSRIDIEYTSITLDKKETYTSTCQYEVPIVQSCKALPYRQGEFAYWESEEVYPDNAELYNSARLKIKPTSLEALSDSQLARFEDEFTTGVDVDGNYIWAEDGNGSSLIDFRCKPIRHFKMPDNKVAPFMWSTSLAPFASSIIFPLGVSIDENIINVFLDIAVENDLLTQKERDELVSYEVVRSDRIGNKSVIASGYLYDMRLAGQTLYANYPYNDLGVDKLNQLDFNGESNHNFTFHSPETDFEKIVIPSELKVEGYVFGRSKGNFAEVKDHPRWVILGAKSKDLALRLAGLEAASELAAETANSAETFQLGFGLTAIFNVAGIVLGIISAVTGALSTVVRIGRYRYEWLQTFRNLGSPRNFAYYYTSEGFYNYLRPIQEENNLVRGINVGKNLREGTFKTINEVNGEKISINNKKRERSVFLSLGREFPLTWEDEYANYDNNKIDTSVSSMSFAGELGNCADGQGEELMKNIASPYVKLKNYTSGQYGTIGSINWLFTGYKGNLLEPQTSCNSIFGGDIFISRYELKRKMPIFSEDAMQVASLTPFNYRQYINIGAPLFWCDYEVGGESSVESLVFPDINSDYNFDCQAGTRDMYVRSPSKFYLYYYGIPNILCETEINTNFRYGGLEPKDSFASNVGDIIEWTQEKNVSITEVEKFQYNNVYSRPVTRTTFDTRLWPDNYSSEIEEKKRIANNNVIYSLQDNSENDSFDPWLIYRALDKYEFPKKYGNLIHLKDLESATILGRFENQQVLFNAIDTLSNQQNQITIETGNAGIFQKRPLEFKSTDLGFAGTQNTDMVSTPYGHYTVDAQRGKIFQLDQTGRDLQPISDFIGKDSSGMKNWFKEHLPFKLLKQFPNVDIDNKYKGIGISMGWDARFDRVFITKKDYIAKNLECLDYNEEIGFYDSCAEEPVAIYFDDAEYFEDVSWTIAYKVTDASWLSYYSFKPEYYIGQNEYYQTGKNFGTEKESLWNHLLRRNSYQVFYGEKFPFTVEIPVKNEGVNKMLSNISLEVEARRYTSDWDYSNDIRLGFNRVEVHNATNSSGLVNLKLQKSLTELANYPQTNTAKTEQTILFTALDDKHNFNYLYNRTQNQNNRVPLHIWDTNRINRNINPIAVNFKHTKTVLERLRGNYFAIRLTQDNSSQFQFTLKNAITTTDIY